jgi:hypothetical protein
VKLNEEDRLITKKYLQNVLENAEADWLDALIVRTLPNDESKKWRAYMQHPRRFFDRSDKLYFEKGAKHLLVDMPSIDRAFDAGKLSNHRVFWNVAPESRAIDEASLIHTR